MRRAHPFLLIAALVGCGGSSDTDTNSDTDTDTDGPDVSARVACTTTLGAFTLELDPEKAPITTANFLQYVDDGFYDGGDGRGNTIFHRVIPGFMAQGGGLLANGSQKSTRPAIAIESDNGLSNVRGTVAMARTNDPNSATSQFFVNVVDNLFLNYQNASNPGYAVFGAVVDGLEVFDAMVAEPRNSADRPNTDIVIESCGR
jgi:cyclophilin family peptidyl-prolyl cis-trans isomerase